QTIVRRNSVYVGFILVGAFFGEQAVDKVGNSLWESNNKGVSHGTGTRFGWRA
ncbi:hypothetical protein F751_1545, partial [Auxenochlorella protothecoides]